MAGRRAENELILDYDLPAEDDFDDEVTNAILLQNRISSPTATGGSPGPGFTADVSSDYDDNGLVEQAIMDRYTRDFHAQPIDYPSDHHRHQQQQQPRHTMMITIIAINIMIIMIIIIISMLQMNILHLLTKK